MKSTSQVTAQVRRSKTFRSNQFKSFRGTETYNPTSVDILYVVEPGDEENEEGSSWEGHISSFKKFADRAITKSEQSLTKKIERVYERVIEAEARDST